MSELDLPTDRNSSSLRPMAPLAGSTDCARSRRARLLVVDDDPSIRLVLAKALTRFGYEVSLAESGPHALAQLDDQPGIDAVLSDVDMAPMTGPQLVERIHERHPGMPILYVTGSAGAADLRHDPSIALIPKPINLTQLKNAVEAMIHQRTPESDPATPSPRTGASGTGTDHGFSGTDPSGD